MNKDKDDIKTKVRIFLTDNLEIDLASMSPDAKIVQYFGVHPDDYERVMEQFELEFEITGRIGISEIQRDKKRAQKPIYIQLLKALFSDEVTKEKTIHLHDMTPEELTNIAIEKSWPSNMLG